MREVAAISEFPRVFLVEISTFEECIVTFYVHMINGVCLYEG